MKLARKSPITPRAPAPRAAAALSAAGVRPSKSRGQNFLVSAAVADRIVASAKLRAGRAVVEIGPGLAILTERIAAQPIRRLILVELDARLAATLQERFGGDPRVRVIPSDFLEIDLASLIEHPPITIAGNLPFNAAAAILKKLCAHARMIDRMVLMFQREVAERIRAHPGDAAYSALSVYTALYWNIDSHFRVAAGSFHPRPKVDAEVLVFTPLDSFLFEPAEERRVLDTIRASFSAPRKTLRNALSHALGLSATKAVTALERAAISPAVRAETLAVADFVQLSRALSPDAFNSPISGRPGSRDA
ncbi:MAG TPA: 16S rRNA (adenine(1518)-N(6)/adenine(1519)-N(6))-dimethyltransferase RsmA [Candidatus Binataceae bacterium]